MTRLVAHWFVAPDPVAVLRNRESSPLDTVGLPARVLFCVWLI
jgi:hypothetical protein